jgi:rod shape-determining protein MreD
MKSSIKNIFTSIGFFLVPIISILFLEIFLYAPRSNSFWNFMRLTPFYIGIYTWISIRQDAFNLISAFILGFFADVLSGAPIGINIMSFLLLYIISSRILFYFNIKKFSYSWVLFTLASLVTLIFKGVLLSVFYRKLIPINFLFIEFVLTLALYPIITPFYVWVERRYIHLEDSYEKI